MTQAEVRVLTLNIPDPISPDSGYIARTGSPVVSWTPISGAVSYDVETALDAAFTMGVTRFNVTASEAQRGVEFGYTYYWRVRAIGPLGVSQFSTSRTFVVPDPTPAQDFAHDTDGRGYLLGQFKEGS
jgi:hypothetical protein